MKSAIPLICHQERREALESARVNEDIVIFNHVRDLYWMQHAASIVHPIEIEPVTLAQKEPRQFFELNAKTFEEPGIDLANNRG